MSQKYFLKSLSEEALNKQIIQNAGTRSLTKPRRRKRTLCLFLSLFVARLFLMFKPLLLDFQFLCESALQYVSLDLFLDFS